MPHGRAVSCGVCLAFWPGVTMTDELASPKNEVPITETGEKLLSIGKVLRLVKSIRHEFRAATLPTWSGTQLPTSSGAVVAWQVARIRPLAASCTAGMPVPSLLDHITITRPWLAKATWWTPVAPGGFCRSTSPDGLPGSPHHSGP